MPTIPAMPRRVEGVVNTARSKIRQWTLSCAYFVKLVSLCAADRPASCEFVAEPFDSVISLLTNSTLADPVQSFSESSSQYSSRRRSLCSLGSKLLVLSEYCGPMASKYHFIQSSSETVRYIPIQVAFDVDIAQAHFITGGSTCTVLCGA